MIFRLGKKTPLAQLPAAAQAPDKASIKLRAAPAAEVAGWDVIPTECMRRIDGVHQYVYTVEALDAAGTPCRAPAVSVWSCRAKDAVSVARPIFEKSAPAATCLRVWGWAPEMNTGGVRLALIGAYPSASILAASGGDQ